MRKAAWGAIGLALFAIATMRPIAQLQAAHSILSLGVLAGYILLSLDPPAPVGRQRAMMAAGMVCALGSFILVLAVTPPSEPARAVAGLLAVAVVALPLWLIAGSVQAIFGAAAALAAMGPFLPPHSADYASVAAFGIAGAAALWVAWRLHHPVSATGQRKAPRIAVAYDVVRFSDEEKAERIARLDKRLAAGEIPEHKYWDLRQEIESK